MMMKHVAALVWWTLLSEALAVTRPPAIFLEPSQEVVYAPGEALRLPCVANSSLPITYTWTRNGLDFMPGGNDDRIVQLDKEGTIVFNRVEEKDEGIFQCTASNALGRSLSHNVKLKEAKLEDFRVSSAITSWPQLGSSLTLNCVPPESIPWSSVLWVLVNNTDGSFEAVNYDARVTMDLEYRLRFTNVEAGDGMDGRAYACMVRNAVLGKIVLGPHRFIRTVGNIEELRPTSYMWASPEGDFGLQGQRYTAKCIFSGNPTPEVHWERIDGSSMPDRSRIGSFGQELTIEDLQFEDAGTYRCHGTNHVSNDYPAHRSQRTITLRVESRPYWVQEPQDVQVGLWGTAEFTCGARAVPEPQYYWLINGVPLHDVRDPIFTSDRFQRPSPDRIVFSRLLPQDTMVIQCNATNRHGYVWADVYLSVVYNPFTLAPRQTTNNLPDWSEAAEQRPIG